MLMSWSSLQPLERLLIKQLHVRNKSLDATDFLRSRWWNFHKKTVYFNELIHINTVIDH